VAIVPGDLFLYQQKAEPVAVTVAPDLVQWRPIYPDRVLRPRVSLVSGGVEPFNVALVPVVNPAEVPVWLPTFPHRVPPGRVVHPWAIGFMAAGIGFAPVRESQEPVEVLFQYGAVPVRASQIPVEALWQYALANRVVRASQISVEILYPFGCFIFQPPPPGGCPVAFTIDTAPADVACPAETFNDQG